MLLALLAAATLARLSLSAAASFGTALALVLCTEFFAAPVTIIVDAAVTAACTKVRMGSSLVGDDVRGKESGKRRAPRGGAGEKGAWD